MNRTAQYIVTVRSLAPRTCNYVTKPAFKTKNKKHYYLYHRPWSFSDRSLSSHDNSAAIAAAGIDATEKWFHDVVIDEKLCPFASPLIKQQQEHHQEKNNNKNSNKSLLRIVTSSANNAQDAIHDVQKEIHYLMEEPNAKHETTLVVFVDHITSSFVKDYIDFVRLSWSLQTDAVGEKYQEKLQLVLFHPRATHQTYAAYGNNSNSNDDGNDNDDMMTNSPADYTIRSPYPTIHLLREEDVLKAVQSGYPDLEYLPTRNKTKFIKQGIDVCRQRLQDCYTTITTNRDNDERQLN